MNSFLSLLALMSLVSSGEWRSQTTGPFTVLYLPKSEALAESILPGLGPSLLRVSEFLEVAPPERIQVVVAPDLPTFQTIQGGQVPPWVSGLADPTRGAIYLRPLSGMEVRHSSLDSVIAHELAHLCLARKVKGHAIPRWLNEGVAVHLGDEPFSSRAERLMPMAITGRFIPFRQLEDDFPNDSGAAATAYAESGDFVRFLIGQFGAPDFLSFLDLLSQGMDYDLALTAVYHATLTDLQNQWARQVKMTYGLFPALTGALLWFLISVLAILAYLRKRREARAAREAEGYQTGSFTPRPPPRPELLLEPGQVSGRAPGNDWPQPEDYDPLEDDEYDFEEDDDEDDEEEDEEEEDEESGGHFH